MGIRTLISEKDQDQIIRADYGLARCKELGHPFPSTAKLSNPPFNRSSSVHHRQVRAAMGNKVENNGDELMRRVDIAVKRQGPIATVTLNRSTLSLDMLRELREIALSFQDDPDTRVVIVRGKSKNFSAGLDLKDQEIKMMLGGPLEERWERVLLGPRACRAWEETSPVTIAAIEGYCVGGGVSLVIACDFRIMGESAFLRIPELSLGLNYSWGSIPRLVHLIGPAKAKQMILLCERVPAEKCLEWGLAEQVVPDGSSVKAAIAMAEKILTKPPIPVAMTKKAVTAATAAIDHASIYMDADQFLLTSLTEDHEEGLRAFFGKDTPDFKGK
jgi:enoyl-CoA hydratase